MESPPRKRRKPLSWNKIRRELVEKADARRLGATGQWVVDLDLATDVAFSVARRAREAEAG